MIVPTKKKKHKRCFLNVFVNDGLEIYSEAKVVKQGDI